VSKPKPFLKKATGSAKGPASVVPKKRHGLGRGIDGLLSSSKPVVPVEAPAANAPRPPAPAAPAAPAPALGAPLELNILDIERSPYQPRREFKEAELRELGESIKNNGLVQPPTVRKNSAGRYELIAGERRLRAAQLIGWKKIQVVVKDVDDQTAAIMTTTENLQREDLNPIEEAISYKTLQDRFNLTQADVADRVGKGRATVANSVRLLELPDEVKALVQSRLLSVGHAKVLLGMEDEKERILLARDCVNDQLSVRALERKIEKMKAPAVVRHPGTPDMPDSYVRSLADKLRRHLGCAVRLTSGVTHANGKHTKGVLEIDFFDNDELDRVIKMIGVEID
jgi:ParB family chromosome partitioning protein